ELEDVLQQEMVENPMLEEREEPEERVDATVEPGEVDADGGEQGDTEEVLPEEVNSFDEINIESYFQEYYDAQPGTAPMREERDQIQLENTLAARPTMEEQLCWQLEMNDTSPLEMDIGRVIIGNLDEEGYLTADIEELVAMGDWSAAVVESALARVQQLDPPGVAARDLRECLLLQLDHFDASQTLAHRIVDEHLDLLIARAHSEIARRCGVWPAEVEAAVELIQSLNPKPGAVYLTESSRYIVPDVTVIKDAGKYRVILNEDGLPKLRISRLYRQMLRSRSELPKDASEYLQTKLKSALWLIKSYGQRQRTIQRVAESIVKHQVAFLEGGLAELRPLVLRDVADDIEMHESTVSRVVNGKFMSTPQGILEMRFFFHSALGHSSGSEVSSVSVKETIRKLIAAEDAQKPLSDARIAAVLKEDGLRIARRTVAKYREEMGIVASKSRRAPR
ncbi:MAG: RNA polymerase factor sigma-54, partial [Acidobacteria bacterium]|nr:RNA polymerase factor sigma-54 [Acidobacteriota bacterium]